MLECQSCRRPKETLGHKATVRQMAMGIHGESAVFTDHREEKEEIKLFPWASSSHGLWGGEAISQLFPVNQWLPCDPPGGETRSQTLLLSQWQSHAMEKKHKKLNPSCESVAVAAHQEEKQKFNLFMWTCRHAAWMRKRAEPPPPPSSVINLLIQQNRLRW